VDFWKKFGEKEVSHSMAHYLQAIASLKEDKGHARVGDIADVLGVSRSGVTSMLRSLQSRGLVDHERYGCVELTDGGRSLASRTESNRRVLTVFMTEILGVPEDVAGEDACMMEHLVSADVISELLRLITFMRSQHPAALEFREAFRASPHACGTAASDSCDLCGDSCLREAATQAAGKGNGRS